MKEQRLQVKACSESEVHALADEIISRLSEGNQRVALWALADAYVVIAQRGVNRHAFMAVEPLRALSETRKLYSATRLEPVLSPVQEKVVRAIGRHIEVVSIGILVHETGLSRGSVNSAADVLQTRGLIRRSVIQKSSYFSLTEAGAQYRAAAPPMTPLIANPMLNDSRPSRAPVLLRK